MNLSLYSRKKIDFSNFLIFISNFACLIESDEANISGISELFSELSKNNCDLLGF
jgi:hypothetical protein